GAAAGAGRATGRPGRIRRRARRSEQDGPGRRFHSDVGPGHPADPGGDPHDGPRLRGRPARGGALPVRWGEELPGVSVRVVLVAAVLTLLNAWKPVTIDDPTYLRFAQQIAQDPSDPYGCTWFWYEEPQPANEILAPAVFLYYLAGVLRLVGDNLVLVK